MSCYCAFVFRIVMQECRFHRYSNKGPLKIEVSHRQGLELPGEKAIDSWDTFHMPKYLLFKQATF